MIDIRAPDRRPPHLNDDEIVAKMERAARAQARFLWTMLLTFFVITSILAGGFVLHLPQQLAGSIAFALLLVWILSVFLNRDYPQPSPEAFSDTDLLRKTLDAQQQRFRWFYVFYFVLLILFAVVVTIIVLFHRNLIVAHSIAEQPGAIVFAIELSVFALLEALMVCFGPEFRNGPLRRALNDELARAQQHRAAMFGYILSVFALCAVLIAQLIHASWGTLALPGAIAAVIVLPGVYFLVQQWRAGRGDG